MAIINPPRQVELPDGSTIVVSEEEWVTVQEKKADGTYLVKYPKVKSKSGVTFDEHLTDIASQEVGKGADIIGLPDPNNLFTATNVGGAMQELFTNVSNGKSLVGGAITDVDNSVVIPTDPTFQDLADAIGRISTGKKWASGTIDTTDDRLSAETLSVRGLDFKPSIILVYNLFLGGNRDPNSFQTIYVKEIAEFMDGYVDINTYSNKVTKKSLSRVSIYSDGFDILFNKASYGSDTHEWIAFE